MMLGYLRTPRWSPYAVGVGIGVLSWITFALMGKALGASTTMVRAGGAIERLIVPGHVDDTAYLTKYLGTAEAPQPVVDWQFALVVALALGAFAAARLGRVPRPAAVPEPWRARFGSSRGKRYAAAFAGGAIMLFGARLAGGCTSGHAISGGLQLALSSWVFLAAMFAGGVAGAMALFGRVRGGVA